MFLKRKVSLWFMIAGFFSAMVLSFGYDVWEREGWRVQKYVCKNTGYRNKFFEKNREKFEELEDFFDMDRDWEFGFFECNNWYNCYMMGKDRQEIYRVTDQDQEQDIYIGWHDITEEDVEKGRFSEELKVFLDFSQGKSSIQSVILHGDLGFVLYPDLKRYLEVRCITGAEMISFLYAPGEAIEGREGWEIEALDDGWYFSVYEYDAVKRTR